MYPSHTLLHVFLSLLNEWITSNTHGVAWVVQIFEKGSGSEGDAGEVGWRGTTLAGWHLCICENYICRNCFLSCACNMHLHDGLGFVSHPSSSSCHHIVCSTNSIWTCRKDRGTLRCDGFSVCLYVSGCMLVTAECSVSKGLLALQAAGTLWWPLCFAAKLTG